MVMKKQRGELTPTEIILGLAGTCAWDWFTRTPSEAPLTVYHGWAQIGLLILSIALSYIAGKLLAKRQKPKFDDRVTTIASRGSYIPRLLGRRKMGCIFAWAGGRYTRKEKQDGGKGSLFAGPKATIYVEHGWHILAMGPCHKLHNITQNGEALFTGPITAESHPSGSTIDLGKEGSFRIFWGEFDQPVNTFLGDATRVTATSRWPGLCYIEWTNKRLGPAAIWPTIEYELECRPQSTILVNTPAYMEPTRTLDGNIATPPFDVVPGAADVGYFEFAGNITSQFFPGQIIRLTSHTGMVDQDVTLIRNELRIDPVFLFTYAGQDVYRYDYYTQFYFDVAVVGNTNDGQLQGYTEAADDGLNAAHIIAEFLFEDSGYGQNLDQDLFDMDSLEDLGTRCVTENMRCSVVGQDGVTYQEMIGGMLIDLGVFLSTDYETGLLKFVPIREPVGTLPVVSEALQTSLPEISVLHGDLPVTNVAYSFKDRGHQYEDTTIGADNDGQATQVGVQRTEINQIISTVNYQTASVMAERRQQEALAGGAQIMQPANRSTRQLIPGSAIYADGLDERLRLLTVEADPLSGEVKLQVVTDYYGAPLSAFQQNPGLPEPEPTPTDPDPEVAIVEVPEYLLNGQQAITLLVPRLRDDAGVAGADLHLSRDDTTFTLVGRDLTIMAGGILIDPMTALDFQAPTGSYNFTAVGPDIDDVLDLSSDLVSWSNGRQLAILVDPDSGSYEICLLKKVTAAGGGIYSLDGIIRARYDTPQQSFTAGAYVFILQNDDGLIVQDVLLEPQVAVFVKTQPFGTGGQLPLDEAASVALALYGKGIRPITPANIRIDTNLLTWTAGADFVVRWDYFTPRTVGSGAGFQGAGSAASDQVPEGDFLVEILNGSGTLIRQFNQATATYTYTNAQRVTDFGGDPTSLKFRITQLRGGYSSDTNTQTFTKV
jgi:hypothetical protein